MLTKSTSLFRSGAFKVAVRAGVIVSLNFALVTWLIGGDDAPTIATFGSFILMAMVTFAGRSRQRLTAYLVLAATGFVLIPLGTFASFHVIAASIVSFVVILAIFYLGVLNGYVAAARNGACLLFILPVMVQAEPSAIPDRLIGWAFACAICIPAAMLIWPRPWVGSLRRSGATALSSAATLIRNPSEQALDQARKSVSEFRARFLDTPNRPTGQSGSAAAIAALVAESEWLLSLAATSEPEAESEGQPPEALRSICADALEHAAAALLLPSGRAEAEAVRTALDAHVESSISTLRETGAKAGENAPDSTQVDEAARLLERDFSLRKISYSVLEIVKLVNVSTGSRPEPEPSPTAPREASHLSRYSEASRAGLRLLAEHADLRSSWLRNSLRGAIGIALAILVADLLSAQNAFWVALGTLSILRSSALGTKGSVVSAITGTLCGILVGTAIILAVGEHRDLLWALLPLAVFFAAFAGRAISFGAGQAGFSLLVMVLYNLIEPVGWQIGVVRIEDVLIGCAVCIVVGFLVWPRGARDVIRGCLADSYRASARLLIDRAEGVLAGKPGTMGDHPWQSSVAASDRLDASLRQFLDEASGEHIDLNAVTALSRGGLRLRRTAQGVGQIPNQVWFQKPDTEHAADLAASIRRIGGWYESVGDAIDARTALPPAQQRDEELTRTLVGQLITAEGRSVAFDRALAAIWLDENLIFLTSQESRLHSRVGHLFPAASTATN